MCPKGESWRCESNVTCSEKALLVVPTRPRVNAHTRVSLRDTGYVKGFVLHTSHPKPLPTDPSYKSKLHPFPANSSLPNHISISLTWYYGAHFIIRLHACLDLLSPPPTSCNCSLVVTDWTCTMWASLDDVSHQEVTRALGVQKM